MELLGKYSLDKSWHEIFLKRAIKRIVSLHEFFCYTNLTLVFHHPDIQLYYGQVIVDLETHDEMGMG